MASNDNPEGASTLSTWANNFTRNSNKMITDMQLKDWIRIVIIVGTYCLIRPHLLKLGARIQEKQHAKDAEEIHAEIHPNELRGKVEIPGVGDSDEENDEDEKPGDWGRSARVRQRKFIRDALKKEEERLAQEQEDEEDKDIAEFLTE
ncbi:protein trafficking Pga2 [Lophiotrema nucula]|uniref:Protein trafficking Pga2 n=1 Tax=Lophiotrema nucula TaxID=690887 RepID=A0A6A5ZE07_9PLEO|nr:protein trafficking Pga2 [Lophiotrema nucula]